MNAKQVLHELKSEGTSERAKSLQKYFKTGKGEYGEGDIFWGLSVPQVRLVARHYKDIPLSEVKRLLQNEVHEARLCALEILCFQMKKNPDEVHKFYLSHTKYVNNWDLVDGSAEDIVGNYLVNKDRKLLYSLARSKSIWERRIAMIATFAMLKNGESKDTLAIAEVLLYDPHDLIQKAVGWLLREVGNYISIETEEKFLDTYAATMPRTTLRYSIEKFSPEKRQYYLSLKKKLSDS